MKEKIYGILNTEMKFAFKFLSALSYVFIIGYLLYIVYLSWGLSSYTCEEFNLNWTKILNNPFDSFLTIITNIFISFLVSFGLYGVYTKTLRSGQRLKAPKGIVFYIMVGIFIFTSFFIYKMGCIWQGVILLLPPELAIFLLSLFLFYIYYNIAFKIRYPYEDL